MYEEVYQRSMRDPEGFWAAAAEDIYWDRRWDKVFDDSRPPYYRWFTGGRLNTCFNALDLHIERGRGKQLALIYDSPVTGTVRAYTYEALRGEVAHTAGALRRHIEAGDIAGAAVDVFDLEPLRADHLFRRLPNFIGTPHVGYVTEGSYEVFYGETVENIRAWIDGWLIRMITTAQ